MLGIMRKYKQSIIIKAVFSIIVLSFIGTIFLIWGEGEMGFSKSGYAAKVNGEKIPYDEYQQAYEDAKNSIQQIYGQRVTPELEKQLNLRQYTLENLINRTLVRQAAKKMGIKVSDKELVTEISKMPYFQKDGVFNKNLYEQVLKANRRTPSSFESSVREEILVSKAGKEIADKVTLSDQDLLQYFKKTNDTINLQYVSFSPAEERSGITVTEQELKSFLQQHEKEYMTQEEIELSYVSLDPARLLPGLSVNSEEIQSYYQKNIDRYQGKEGILPLDQVKERVKKDALQLKAAKQAYETVAIALNKNLAANDLVAAARMLDLPVSKTALFTQNAPPKALAEQAELIKKAFTTKDGILGGPVETSKGIYLFKVTKRNPSAVAPLSSVKAELEKRVLDRKAFDLAKKKAEEALQKMRKGDFQGKLQTTGLFSYSGEGTIPAVGRSREAMDAAILLTPSAAVAENPFNIDGRWFAIRLKERVEADTAGFEKGKDKIRQILLPKKQQEAREAWLKELKSKAKIVINPALKTD